MCLRTFLDEIQFQITFILNFFQVVCIFCSVETLNECILSFLYSIIFQPHQSFEPPSSTLWEGGDRHMLSRTFLDEI